MLENIIGVDEAAERLGLSSGTIKNMCAAGRINAKKIGKTWVLDKTNLEVSNAMRIYYNDNGDMILVGEVLTNHSMTVEEALDLISFDPDDFARANGFLDGAEGIDYNEFVLK